MILSGGSWFVTSSWHGLEPNRIWKVEATEAKDRFRATSITEDSDSTSLDKPIYYQVGSIRIAKHSEGVSAFAY